MPRPPPPRVSVETGNSVPNGCNFTIWVLPHFPDPLAVTSKPVQRHAFVVDSSEPVTSPPFQTEKRRHLNACRAAAGAPNNQIFWRSHATSFLDVRWGVR